MGKMSFVRPIQNARKLHGLFKNRVLIYEMLKDIYRGNYKPSFANFLLFIVGLIYIFFPMDVMPDIIPIIGWVDDGVVIFFLAKTLLNEADKYVKWKQQSEKSLIIPLDKV